MKNLSRSGGSLGQPIGLGTSPPGVRWWSPACPRLVAWIPMTLGKNLRLPVSALLGLGGVDLQEEWGIAYVGVSNDLRVHAQVWNYC